MHLLLGFYGHQLKRAKSCGSAAKTHVATINNIREYACKPETAKIVTSEQCYFYSMLF
jgi:hypothetical protein